MKSACLLSFPFFYFLFEGGRGMGFTGGDTVASNSTQIHQLQNFNLHYGTPTRNLKYINKLLKYKPS
jgi:hypothetical protein